MAIVQSRRHLLANIAMAGVTGFTGLGAEASVAAENRLPPSRRRKSRRSTLRGILRPVLRRRPPRTCCASRVSLISAMSIPPMRASAERRLPGRGRWVICSRTTRSILPGYSVPSLIMAMEARAPITTTAGLHVGCSEVFGKNDIRAMANLKGSTVGIATAFEDELLKALADLVGPDPGRDIHWVTSLSRGPMELFAGGKVDAFVVVSPALQGVRARNIGHVVVNRLWTARGRNTTFSRTAQISHAPIRLRPTRLARHT